MDAEIIIKGLGGIWLGLIPVAYVREWDWYMKATLGIVISVLCLGGLGLVLHGLGVIPC